jgi:hypothetical protein
MSAQEIQSKIENYINSSKFFEEKRDYVGMSQISKCPRQIYNEFLRGQQATDERNRMAYLGYAFEDMVKKILNDVGLMCGYEGREIVGFSERFVGHTDGEDIYHDLIEIKSVSRNKFERVLADGRAFREHYDQVQMYMRYGVYHHAHIIYVCREDLRVKAIGISCNNSRADELVLKAKIVLDAIETGNAPKCQCGKCEE